MELNNVSQNLFADEDHLLTDLIKHCDIDEQGRTEIYKRGEDFIARIREKKTSAGSLDAFVQQYGLETREGIALMALAEALLRVPDSATANALIKDKIKAAKWLDNVGESSDWMMKAAGVGLFLSSAVYDSILQKLGEPVIRKATLQAMAMLGQHFVLGQTIEDAVGRGETSYKNGYSYSFDMLGEGARTMPAAATYFDSYSNALDNIASAVNDNYSGKLGLSVKLSALYPRYEYNKRDECIDYLTNKVLELAKKAKAHNLMLTIDAEETYRLELSLEIFKRLCEHDNLKGWNGLGLAVQAYQKRAYDVVNFILDLAKRTNRVIPIRLVKGAYWDTEIKYAQVQGLEDYPVFTRKVNTDVSYLACARKLLENREFVYPMLATHNVQTVSTCIHLAQSVGDKNLKGFEFQKLHGMGDNLYAVLREDFDVPVNIYAPVGTHEDLLPYLVRRLLENGANSSFVHQLANKKTPAKGLLKDPVEECRGNNQKRHLKIPLPLDIYRPHRENSKGVPLYDDETVDTILRNIQTYAYNAGSFSVTSLVDGSSRTSGKTHDSVNPANIDDVLGTVRYATEKDVEDAFKSVKRGYESWSRTPAKERARILNAIADYYEYNADTLMGLCMREAGKTLADAVGELREAIDFCRYYAANGEVDFHEAGIKMPGPTGESNVFTLNGRGVFVCVSPWNFPLAIFTGQVVAALMAGNTVVAKPAEDTSVVAAKAVELMLKAGVPDDAIALVLGEGAVGQQIINHPDVAGVAFTGSTATARAINKTLAAKDGAITPLIAETGGQNAIIADASALPEQLVDDVIASAFQSAGQRCSACRILYIQNDTADRVIELLKGAMEQLTVGNTIDLKNDIGPVISVKQQQMLSDHIAKLKSIGTEIYTLPLSDDLKKQGYFVPPAAYEIDDIGKLDGEVFGPILHVIRYKPKDLEKIIGQINDTGYGLTFGVHSRIQGRAYDLACRSASGNCYINRTIVGSVVGTQPFGGNGLSGTGPKAGGPHYLHRFACEKVITDNIAAAGGNVTLLSLEDE